MDKTRYFIIGRNEDEPFMSSMDKDELIKRLSENYWGNVKFMTEYPHGLCEFPPYSIFIMKGEIVVPKPKKVVETYEVI